MNCPECGKDALVINTRMAPSKDAQRRRRRCVGCGYRFTTYEITHQFYRVLLQKPEPLTEAQKQDRRRKAKPRKVQDIRNSVEARRKNEDRSYGSQEAQAFADLDELWGMKKPAKGK